MNRLFRAWGVRRVLRAGDLTSRVTFCPAVYYRGKIKRLAEAGPVLRGVWVLLP